MMGIFLFAVLLGFPIAFTLMAMGIGFGYYAYYDRNNDGAYIRQQDISIICSKHYTRNG
jgi:TRAP-type mannitol/chloroaromatic compound transport system permease large subunit